MKSGLNAPFGARCFLTSRRFCSLPPWLIGLNAPYGAWCFLTRQKGSVVSEQTRVLMHLLPLGAF